MAFKGTASKSASGASMSKYDVEVEARLKALEAQAHPDRGCNDGDDGDRVAGLTQLGGYAEITKVNKQSIYKMPNSISHDEACAMLCAYGTSHYALKQRAKIKNGETLVVLGASGSTGIAAIQIGKIYGAKVIAASSSKEKQDFTKKLGADISIGYENLKKFFTT